MKRTDISEGAIGICQIDQRLGDRLKRELQKVIRRERMRRKRAGEADFKYMIQVWVEDQSGRTSVYSTISPKSSS